MNTFFIQKKRKGDFDRQRVREVLQGARVSKMKDIDFTVDGEDVPFLAAESELAAGDLDDICRRLSEQGLLAMRSGVVEATAIAGVFRQGHKIYGYGEEGSFLQTEIVDERCRITFPLITTRNEREAKPRFEVLGMTLPTDMETIDRRVSSLKVLEGADERELVREASSHLAIATLIYPRALIWRHSEVPPVISTLLATLEECGDAPEGQSPAHLIMTDAEIRYLNLHLYIRSMHERSGDHIKPMSLVVRPMIFESRSAGYPGRTSAEELAQRAAGVRTVSDLNSVINAARGMAHDIFGGSSSDRRINITRRSGNVSIRFTGGVERED